MVDAVALKLHPAENMNIRYVRVQVRQREPEFTLGDGVLVVAG